ncbi:hypothetical protein [Paenibacillus sp. FSL L8-0158]|uniref:hypothetical protein n=1 Tax=Paenibacillus sp. FSL L8-0158 TaxID=2954752 RepID=UPI003159570C
MALFITYVLLGFSIALPVGTITVEMTKQGLKNGFMHGWIVGLGGMTLVATTRKAMNRTAIKWVTIGAGVVLIGF